jgi:hypothetical protein
MLVRPTNHFFFQSFVGLAGKQQQLDGIYDKEITKRYCGYEIQHLSKRHRERETGGEGRHFKLGIKDKSICKFHTI